MRGHHIVGAKSFKYIFEEVIESQMAGGCSVLLILFYDDGMGVDDLEPSSSPYVLLSLFQWEKK